MGADPAAHATRADARALSTLTVRRAPMAQRAAPWSEVVTLLSVGS